MFPLASAKRYYFLNPLLSVTDILSRSNALKALGVTAMFKDVYTLIVGHTHAPELVSVKTTTRLINTRNTNTP